MFSDKTATSGIGRRALYHFSRYRVTDHRPDQPVLHALEQEDILYLIVDSLANPTFSASISGTHESKSARRDLFHLALVSPVFFHPAMEAMWKVLPAINHLMNVLWVDSAGTEGGTNTASSGKGFRKMSRFVEILQCNDGSPNPIIKHFRFYASCVRRLNAPSHNYPFALLAYVKSLIGPDTGELFPALRQLVWVEYDTRRALSGDMTQFFPSSQLVDITLRFETGGKPATMVRRTPEQRNAFQETVIHLCSAIRRGQPALRHLTIDAPIHIPIPACAVIRDFGQLVHLNLRMCMSADSDLPKNGRGSGLASLRVLELLWTRKSDVSSLLANVSFNTLQQITIKSVEGPHDRFLPYASSLMEHVSVCLTSVEIYSFTSPDSESTTLPKKSFHDFVSPLISCCRLRHLSITLIGYCFAFRSCDFNVMALAWADLEVLNLRFTLDDYSSLPTIQYVLSLFWDRCPRLSFLHVPGLATDGDAERFCLPRCSDSPLIHLSSDVLTSRHSTFDIAFTLRWQLPRLTHLCRPGSSTLWEEIHALVNAMHGRDYATVLEHVVKSLRAGTLFDLQTVIFCILLLIFVDAA